MTTRDWTGLKGARQEGVLYNLRNVVNDMTIVQENAAGAGLHALGADIVDAIATHMAAISMLRDLADGSLVAVTPVEAAEIKEGMAQRFEHERDSALRTVHALEGTIKANIDDCTRLVTQRNKARSGRETAAHNHRIALRALGERLTEVERERDEAINAHAETIAKSDGDEADACDTYRAELAAASETIEDLTKERDEAIELRDRYDDDYTALAASCATQDEYDAVVKERDEAIKVAYDDDRRIDEMRAERDTARAAAPARGNTRKPTCHGCHERSLNGLDCDAMDGRTISKSPGATCPCWCPLLSEVKP